MPLQRGRPWSAFAACRPLTAAASMQPALMPQSVQSPARTRFRVAAAVGRQAVLVGAREALDVAIGRVDVRGPVLASSKRSAPTTSLSAQRRSQRNPPRAGSTARGQKCRRGARRNAIAAALACDRRRRSRRRAAISRSAPCCRSTRACAASARPASPRTDQVGHRRPGVERLGEGAHGRARVGPAERASSGRSQSWKAWVATVPTPSSIARHSGRCWAGGAQITRAAGGGTASTSRSKSSPAASSRVARCSSAADRRVPTGSTADP